MPLRSLADLVPPPTQSGDDDVVLDSCSEDEDLEPLHEVTNGAGPSRPVHRIAGAGPVDKSHHVPSGARLTVGPPSHNHHAAPPQSAQAAYQLVTYYSCQWRKHQTKKHKTWNGDAFLRVQGGRIVMFNEASDKMGATGINGDPVPGCELKIGPYELEVDSILTEAEFKASTTILNRPQTVPATYTPSTFKAPFKAPARVANVTRPMNPRIIASSLHISSDYELDIDPQNAVAGPSGIKQLKDATTAVRNAISQKSFYAPTKKAQKIVIGEKSNKKRTTEWDGALHDPNAEGAVVMRRPAQEVADKRNTDIVDVVLDPMLAGRMRPHQKEGVKFMYSCVMGLTKAQAEGCILADEMGLGKTLQTIALIWTLLKQSPFANESGVVGKVLVVCPVSLVDNWKNEFRKWLGMQLHVVVADGSDSQTAAFVNFARQQVLIVGYERLRKIIEKLKSCVPPIDLIVCDEGHRLKSKDNKTTKMFENLRTRRRLILSGTPLQNDLGEWHAMVNFTCPGVLGQWNQFVKQYEKPILKGRAQGASDQAKALGDERFKELGDLCKEFVLRRESKVLQGHLPSKHEYVVFIAPTTWQLNMFNRILNPENTAKLLRGDYEKQPLGYIDLLRKISNTPTLLGLKRDDEGSRSEHLVEMTKDALKELPRDMSLYDVDASGKLSALDQLLALIHKRTKEKVVVVSNWTSTLDVIEHICKTKRYTSLRLDGQTPQKMRQDLVNRFNRQDRGESFVFLLSAKAGGVGLNLIGASRLILFDSDWNPSTDLQAMARIHRDGQKRPVYIYRFLTTNSIDEKIYQRQITKLGLSDQMLDQGSSGKGTKDSFSAAELRDIFRLKLRTDGCQTHDLLGCKCTEQKAVSSDPADPTQAEEEDDEGRPNFVSAGRYDPAPTAKMRRKAAVEQQEKLAALKEWTHYDGFDNDSFNKVEDQLLYKMMYDAWSPEDTTAATSKLPSEEPDELEADVTPEVDTSLELGSDVEEDVEIQPKKKARASKDRKGEKPTLDPLFRGMDDVFGDDSENEGDDDVVFDSEEEDGLEKTYVSPVKTKDQFANDVESRFAKYAYTPSSSPAKVSSSSTNGAAEDKQKRCEDSDDDKEAVARPVRKAATTKRDSNGNAKSKSKAGANEDDFGFGKKHDLRDIAKAGPAGRVMFVFERNSKTTPLGEEDDVEIV